MHFSRFLTQSDLLPGQDHLPVPRRGNLSSFSGQAQGGQPLQALHSGPGHQRFERRASLFREVYRRFHLQYPPPRVDGIAAHETIDDSVQASGEEVVESLHDHHLHPEVMSCPVRSISKSNVQAFQGFLFWIACFLLPASTIIVIIEHLV